MFLVCPKWKMWSFSVDVAVSKMGTRRVITHEGELGEECGVMFLLTSFESV